MHIKKYFFLLGLTLFLSGCNTGHDEWFGEYGTQTAGSPGQIQYGAYNPYENVQITTERRMAVLLPLSGAAESAGKSIRTSIETAVLKRGPQNLVVSFYDTANQNSDAINNALATNPDIVIGPLFADDARAIRSAKPSDLPVLSFTSDATAVGGGVLSMSLMATNSVEAIVKEMVADKINSFIIIAPNTKSGRLMAGTARSAATLYDIPVTGVFYYDEKNSESIKSTTMAASMNATRSAVNTRAREILSDILTKENLSASEKYSLNIQLEKLAKTDTLGKLPYDGVLFLGNGDDTKSLASFLRYYGVGAHDVRFYGTAIWDGSDIASDIMLSGAKYAALPPISDGFANLYEYMDGVTPSRFATFGYDAANLALGMIYSNKLPPAYLLDSSGYMGIDGLFRLRPTGESERALRIVELNGNGTTRTVRPAPTNFITPIYHVDQTRVSPANAKDLETPGISALDYIKIPDRLRGKYKSKRYGASVKSSPSNPIAESVIILPEDDREIVTDPEYTPITRETIGRKYIDEIEISD